MITIKAIAKHNKSIGHHYFDKETLAFFGQQLTDFKVREINGRIFIYAPSGDSWDNEHWSIGEYDRDTGAILSIAEKPILWPSGINDIYEFFNDLQAQKK